MFTVSVMSVAVGVELYRCVEIYLPPVDYVFVVGHNTHLF